MCRSLVRSVALTVAALIPMVANADVKLPSVFGSHMVLQREMPVKVWGWADAGESVTVTFREHSAETQADDDGNWLVTLPALAVGDAATLTVKGKNTVAFEDVLVGEVWVCSGQSNMQWPVQAALDPDLEAAAADFPGLRLFKVPMVTATEPQDDVNATWTHCNSETVPGFTAVGYFFGRKLHRILGVPVGLIQTAWGGTRAEAWTSPSAMAATPELKPIIDTWDARQAEYDAEAAKARYEKAMERWKEAAAKARSEGRPAPRRPRMQVEPKTDRHHYSTLYNAMIAPLSPFTIRGAIWYQGESNAGRAYQYRTLMPTMIQSWRDDWGQGDFPFYQVQLANFRAIQSEPVESDWAELREAQYIATQAIPNVGAACITDIGAAKDIHPKDKQNVGRRLARLALHNDYGYTNIVPQGPTYREHEVVDGKVHVHFDTYGSPLISYYGEPLSGFAITGDDKKWVWANAKIIDADTVEVSHPDVSKPVAVRYNWADNPQGNLYDTMYLPAYPFRTDDWVGVTAKNVNP